MLSDTYWQWYLRTNPTTATSIGIHRYDALLRDISPAARESNAAFLEDLLARIEAVDATRLDRLERITHKALHFQVRRQQIFLECDFESWNVDPRGAPQADFLSIQSYQKLTDVRSGRDMVDRYRAMSPYIEQQIANLSRGLAEGRVATRMAIKRTISQIDELETTPLREWAALKPLQEIPEAWSVAERDVFGNDLEAAVSEGLRPALLLYRDFLRDSLLPAARDSDRPGLQHIDGGSECYRNLIFTHTSLELTPEEIHEIGLAEVARINREMREMGKRILGTDDLDAIHRRLREDPAMHFETRDQVQAKAEEALARAKAAMPGWFGVLPQAPCEVARMEAHEETHSTIAYYRRPASDGSRPGRYYINTYAPETRPRYEAEALAYHEAIPGHHLQIAIMQELRDLPDFRRHAWVTVFGEGWALYTERLSEEMGLYSGDLDRMGMLSFDAWRACRLVVDTGMHALGWTRQQAIDYMLANTVLAGNNIENEVDRYITTPGQALAYKLGQLEILRLRGEAEKSLGEQFDIRSFHDVVLGQGVVDLATLRDLVERWIEETASD
jgi:uncharacterized protein (DUF885 family)